MVLRSTFPETYSSVFERATPRRVPEVDEEWVLRLESSVVGPEIVEFIERRPQTGPETAERRRAARGRF
jgi:hypothetical protein